MNINSTQTFGKLQHNVNIVYSTNYQLALTTKKNLCDEKEWKIKTDELIIVDIEGGSQLLLQLCKMLNVDYLLKETIVNISVTLNAKNNVIIDD